MKRYQHAAPASEFFAHLLARRAGKQVNPYLPLALTPILFNLFAERRKLAVDFVDTGRGLVLSVVFRSAKATRHY